MNPKKIKNDFPIFQEREDLVYLDNAATSQKPSQVINSIEKYYQKNNSNVGRGLYNLSNESTTLYKKARKNIANFIGVKQSEIIFTRNTTESENLIAKSLNIDGEILLSDMSHHSEQLPWRKKAEDENLNISYIETSQGKISLTDFKRKISDNTSVVVISHISNIFGAENPIKEIVSIAHENNALVVLDGAQSAPHISMDVKKLDVDFLCFSGHKMLGPTGIGILYGKKKLLDDMNPYQLGGGMIRKVSKNEITFENTPKKFEAGTPNIAGAIGLSSAVDYLKSIGMKEIKKHDEELVELLYEEIANMEGFELISPRNSIILSFTSDFAHPHDVAEIFNQKNIAVRAGHHCAQPQMEELKINGATRISPYIYNNEDDMEKVIDGLKEVRRVFD